MDLPPPLGRKAFCKPSSSNGGVPHGNFHVTTCVQECMHAHPLPSPPLCEQVVGRYFQVNYRTVAPAYTFFVISNYPEPRTGRGHRVCSVLD